MSHYGGGAQHGDKFNKKDKFDNPIQYTGGNIGGHGHKKQIARSGEEHGNKEHSCCSPHGILHWSSNSGSSSSEDDGQGGRRKKSIKEKIKEKLPGGNKPAATIADQGQDTYAHGHGATTTTPGENYGGGYGATTTTTHEAHDEQPAEKKGFMDKIKDKLPGHH